MNIKEQFHILVSFSTKTRSSDRDNGTITGNGVVVGDIACYVSRFKILYQILKMFIIATYNTAICEEKPPYTTVLNILSSDHYIAITAITTLLGHQALRCAGATQ